MNANQCADYLEVAIGGRITGECASLIRRQHEAIKTLREALAFASLLNEQAKLLRECRLALDELLKKKPALAGLLCGYTTLGNLRADLYAYRPQGVFGGVK